MRRTPSVASLFALLILTFVVAGCSGAPDDAPDVELSSTVTPQRNCRLNIEKTFAAENANLTEICLPPIGGGHQVNGTHGGGGQGSANDDLGWKANGFAACVQGCSSALADCFADGRQTTACGYVSVPTPKLVPGGVAVNTDRVPLPPSAPGGCVQKWHAQCQMEHRACVDQCSNQL